VLLVGGAAEAAGDVYRWTDAEGKVYYGDDPPANVKKQKVSGEVTVVPATRFVDPATASKPSETAKAAEVREAAEAARAKTQANELAEKRRKAIERCEKNRGVDCEDHVDAQGEEKVVSYVPVPVPGWSTPAIKPRKKGDEPPPHQSSPAKTLMKRTIGTQSAPR
jgi:hypothetical protein